MLSAILHLVRGQWSPLATFFSKLWAGLVTKHIAKVTTATTAITVAFDESKAVSVEHGSDGFPATEDQRNQIRGQFIESLDLDAVCAWASLFNGGKPCQFVKKTYGSFNVCFFVEFKQGPVWIVRVPIETSLNDPWTKLISEVTTIQYIERHTRIPVPHIHAYGRNAKLTRDHKRMQMFIIMDCVPGQTLNTELLVSAKKDHRRGFYSQLIDVLADLRKLEFSLIGSLLPGSDDSSEPVIGPVLSMSAAMLCRLPPPTAFISATEYMAFQCSLVSDFLSPSVDGQSLDHIKQEVFALHNIEHIFHKAIDPQLENGPFVLNHLDLRSPNIIVDENLQIQGIIDWEFASTVPLQLFTPPSWITGHDLQINKQVNAEFRDVLDDKSEKDSICSKLRREWYGTNESKVSLADTAFYVAHATHRPATVTNIFCDALAPELFGKPLDDLVSEFFSRHPALESEVQRRLNDNERYGKYLRENGIYDTVADRLKAESRALKEKLKEKYGWS